MLLKLSNCAAIPTTAEKEDHRRALIFLRIVVLRIKSINPEIVAGSFLINFGRRSALEIVFGGFRKGGERDAK